MTTASQNQPTPLFIGAVIIIVVFVGTGFKNIQPVALGLMIVILTGLLLMGYGSIHDFLQKLGLPPAAGITNGPLGQPYDPRQPFPVFSSVAHK